MAFPLAISSAETLRDTTLGNENFTVTMPASVAAGDFLLAFIARAATDTTDATSTGWTVLAGPSTAGGARSTTVLYREADGNEGANEVFALSQDLRAAAQVFRLQRVLAIYASTLAVAGASKDPPSLNPGVGAKDFMWFAFLGQHSAIVDVPTAAPTNYTNLNNGLSSGTGSDALVSTARRSRNAPSENPGAFTTADEGDFFEVLTVALQGTSSTTGGGGGGKPPGGGGGGGGNGGGGGSPPGQNRRTIVGQRRQRRRGLVQLI